MSEGRLNKNGQPYTLPEIVETEDEILIVYGVWSYFDDKLTERSIALHEHLPIPERRKAIQVAAQELTKMLQDGKTVGEPGDMSFMAGVRLGAKRGIQTLASRGQERYKSFMNVFGDWAAKHGRASKPIREVCKRDMYDFLDWIKDSRGVSNSTWNNYREMLKRCMKELVERDIIPSNPCDGIKRLPTRPSRYPFFNDEQQKRLEVYMKTKEPILYQFTRFLYHGFIRPIEVKRIKVNDINLKSRIIMIWSHNNKNKKQQPVIITEGLYKVLVDMEVDTLPGNWYLFGKSMEPGPAPCRTKHKFGKVHRRVLEELDLYDGELQMYDWKHTGVCRAFDAKVDIVSIMHQCRHHSLDQTYTYLRALGRVIQEDLKGKEW